MIALSFSTLEVPASIGASMACAVVMLVSWFLVRALSKAGKTMRATATITCMLIIGLLALSIGIARTYPGPAWRYGEGTTIHWLHVHALDMGSYLALLIPFCAASLVASLWPHGGRRMTLVAAVLAALLIIPSMILMLAVVCNHPGACP